jgi:hypothetical protein
MSRKTLYLEAAPFAAFRDRLKTKNSSNIKSIFSRQPQTGKRKAVIAMTRLSRMAARHLSAYHPKTGGPEIP